MRCPVLELGDPTGRPVVLLPGLTDGLAPVTEHRTRELLRSVPLPMARFHGLAVSHRQPATEPLSTRVLAQDAAAVLDQLLEEPAVLVCHSMGAMVAQHLAADRPDLVAGMVLSATLPRADDAFRALVARWEAQIVAGRIRDFELDALETAYTGEELITRRRMLDDAPPSPTPSPAAVARHVSLSSACRDHDALDRLPEVVRPTLVLAGEHDVVTPLHHSERLAAALPLARLEIFAGMGHGFPEQDPQRFEEQVVRFVEQVPR